MSPEIRMHVFKKQTIAKSKEIGLCKIFKETFWKIYLLQRFHSSCCVFCIKFRVPNSP